MRIIVEVASMTITIELPKRDYNMTKTYDDVMDFGSELVAVVGGSMPDADDVEGAVVSISKWLGFEKVKTNKRREL